MKRLIAAAVAALLAVSVSPAEARPRSAPVAVSYDQDGHTFGRAIAAITAVVVAVRRAGRSAGYSARNATIIGGRPLGCPHAYCGCGASIYAFGRIIPKLNLAANWGRYFPHISARVGAAAYRAHHVVIIIGGSDGAWRVHDSNSGGHQTRIQTLSLVGYRFVDLSGGMRS